MRSLLARVAAVAMLVTLGNPSAPARAQEKAKASADLPSAETVLERFVEATGGRAAYEKIRNRKMTGTIEVVGANLKGTIKSTQAAPDRMVVESDFGPVGKVVQGTDGISVWIVSPVIGEKLLEGEDGAGFRESAVFNRASQWKTAYRKAECTGVEDVNGKPAYRVVVTPKSGGGPITRFYDKASHLEVKEMRPQAGPKGEMTVESYPADYRAVDGVLMPFTVTRKMFGQSVEFKINEIQQNVDLPADAFRKPASLEPKKDEPAKK